MDSILPKFERMGARAKVSPPRRINSDAPVVIDISRDSRGEFFDLRVRPDVQVDVIDVRPRERHLLLLARDPSPPWRWTSPTRSDEGNGKGKFLCGHDERHWFVAAVPERRGVSNVATAMDALKPREVWGSILKTGLRRRDANGRSNEAFVRQGEWFFLPRPELRFEPIQIHRHEPIRRGGGKPHWCDELVRTGGQLVWVSDFAPNGLSDAEYGRLTPQQRKAHAWRNMARDALVFIRGHVRHPDHATIYLKTWHRVVMNTESQSRAMRHVAFLD